MSKCPKCGHNYEEMTPRQADVEAFMLAAILLAFVLAAMPAKHSVTLAWNWTEVHDPAAGFHVLRSARENSGFARIAILTVSERSYTDLTVVAGRTYYYRVLAYNAAGNSKPSNVVRKVIP